MKKLFLIIPVFSIVLGIASCGNGNNKSSESASTETVVSSESGKSANATNALCVEDILKDAENNLGKEVTLKGYITHTCKHSGRRCFVMGNDQKTTIRVESKGNIGRFNRELIGSEVLIKGILRENRLTKEYIDQAEEELREKQSKSEGDGETCDAEMSNIKNMREWMKANNKDYYSVFYLDGTDYEVIQ